MEKELNDHYKKLAYDEFKAHSFSPIVEAIQQKDPQNAPKSFSNIIFAKDNVVVNSGIFKVNSFQDRDLVRTIRFPWIELQDGRKLMLFHMTLTFAQKGPAFESWLKQLQFVLDRYAEGFICVGDANFLHWNWLQTERPEMYKVVHEYALVGPESEFTFVSMYHDTLDETKLSENEKSGVFHSDKGKARIASSLDLLLGKNVTEVKLWNTLGETKDVTQMKKPEYVSYLKELIKGKEEDKDFWNTMITDHLLTTFTI